MEDAKHNYIDVTDAKKKANDFELAKSVMDYYDHVYDASEERIKKINENYQLHSGRWPQIEKMPAATQIQLQHENIVLGGGVLRHYPVIDRISKSVVGDLMVRPLIPIIKDLSSKARNQRDRAKLEIVKNYIQQQFIEPKVKIITQQIMAEYGIQDPMSLQEEQMQQLNADIQRKVQETTPDEIMESINKYRTPEEIIAQVILDSTVTKLDMKAKFDIGGENAVVSGEEYYRTGMMNGMPWCEVLNPKWVTWDGSEHVEFVEDGVFAKYEQYLTPEDVVSRYGAILAKKDINKLAALYSPIPGYSGSRKTNPEIEKRVVDVFAENPALQDIDVRTREGQLDLRNIYKNLSMGHQAGHGIRECYITWKWTRQATLVTRYENGVKTQVFRAAHYVKNPARGDLKVERILIPQIWHGVKLGVADEIYAFVEPVPFQYRSIHNPFDVKLTIMGGRYNTYMNNAENVSLIDLGKPWQYRYNVLMKRMEEYEATDIGKVLLGTVNMKPVGWSWQEWFQSLYIGKVALIGNHIEGAGGMDANIFRSIDLSSNADIQQTLAKLEYFEKKIATSMYYNPSKLGQISPYATNQNAAANAEGSDRQMLRFHDRHRQIKQRVLNALLDVSLAAIRDNEYAKNVLLDDFGKAYLETAMEPFAACELGLYVVDDFQESERLEQMRQLALTILQNGGSVRDIADVVDARSMSGIKDVLDRSERKRIEEAQAQKEHEQGMLQKQEEIRKAQLELKMQFDAEQNERDRQAKLQMAQMNAQLLANANDINKNNVNDSMEKAAKQLEIDTIMKEKDEEMHEEDLKFKYYEADLKYGGGAKKP